MATIKKGNDGADISSHLTNFSSQVAEILTASAKVIDHRSRAILVASQDPLSGDYRELSRMVPEKVDACTRALIAGMTAFCRFQASAWMVGQQTMTLMAKGRPPAGPELDSLLDECNRLGSIATSSTNEMLAPIHRRVTSNARRLQRGASD